MDFRDWWVQGVEVVQHDFEAVVAVLPMEGPEQLKKAEWLAVWVGVLTLFVVLRQTRLMKRQDSTMKRQTALMETQTKIIEKQDWLLSRLPTFSMRVTVFARPQDEYGVEMRLWNVGNKGVRDFYWHVFIPQDSAIQVFFGQERAAVEGVGETEGVRCEEYSKHFQNPLYPTQSVRICELRIDRAILQTNQTVFWNVVCEEGEFPNGGGRSEIQRPA